MQHDLFFQRAGNDHVDFIFNQDPQNRVGRVALLVMDDRIARELQLRKRIAEFLRGFLIAFTHVNHMQIGNKPVPDSLCFREYLLEARGKGARDRNGAVRRWITHKSGKAVSGFHAVRQVGYILIS